jgi:hypothetical protein
MTTEAQREYYREYRKRNRKKIREIQERYWRKKEDIRLESEKKNIKSN